MLVIGIPTLNEANNITKLTRRIDNSLIKLGIEGIIVNADNDSSDKTAENFVNTRTKNNKHSIITNKAGKGHNIKAILNHASSVDDCEGCILIDGDVQSFSTTWLKKFYTALTEGTDFVVPNYSRNFQEGNTTNHFAFPLLAYHTKKKCPRQPIAGDFGLSKKFINFLVEDAQWHKYCFGYGIDIFLTINALYSGFVVQEIELSNKTHNPSFGKMTDMFVEVASSYYETSRHFIYKDSTIFETKMTNTTKETNFFIPKIAITKNAIGDRFKEARQLVTTTNFVMDNTVDDLTHVTASKWIEILLSHEKLIGKKSSSVLARSILPFYLLRVVNYLRSNKNVISASNDINREVDLITEAAEVTK